MDLRTKSSAPGNELPKKVPPDHQSLANFNLQQHQQKWEDPSFHDYGMRIEAQFSEFNNQPSENPSSVSSDPSDQAKIIPDRQDDLMNERRDDASRMQDWDPRAMLSNLSFLEQKIHQLQDLVHLIGGRRGQVVNQSDELVAQQQQLISANLTSIIVQLISTAGSLLPSVKQTLSSNPSISEFGQLGGVIFPSGPNLNATQNINGTKDSHLPNQVDISGACKTEQICTEEHELKDEEDPDDGENLPPGSYEILQLEKEEILAPHTHFCLICGKGFKRDANLRMHMRGHGDEYKTAAALAKPIKESSSQPMLIKRYSCPYAGCKRNKEHKKFQPLKTILCVKNHYKRTHCDKSYTCTRCNTKKFSVIADLKTHEKHCGRDKWLCSCGTTFSRKDKLFGHISLFQGHTPAIPIDEAKGSASVEPTNKVGFAGLNFGSNVVSTVNGVENIVDVKGNADDPASFFSPLTFDSYNLSGFHEFPRPPFEDSETSFSFLISGSCNYPQKTAGGESGSNSNDVV